MIRNGRIYKAISIRYKEDAWNDLEEMKNTYCTLTGEKLTKNKFIKKMIKEGFYVFVENYLEGKGNKNEE